MFSDYKFGLEGSNTAHTRSFVCDESCSGGRRGGSLYILQECYNQLHKWRLFRPLSHPLLYDSEFNCLKLTTSQTV